MVKRAVRPPPARLPEQAIANRLLAALPPEDYRRILPDLKTVPTKVKQVVYKPGEPIRHVYFPNGAVASLTSVMASGAMVEVATVGDEGMLGVGAFFGTNTMAGHTMIQVGSSTAERMTAEAFKREMDRRGALHAIASRYVQALMGSMMQSIACNTLHGVQERCCRWLLTTQDRMHSDEFGLSHEFLAIMLGVRRPSVTIVAGVLQKAGLIKYRHGRITILDRRSLEAASCECYATIRKQFERLQL